MTDDGLAPPAVVLKENEAETLSLPATRSTAAIENETAVTAPPIMPDDTEFDTESVSVSTVTLPPGVGVALIFIPVIVMVTALLFPMVPEFLFMITDICVGLSEVQDAKDDNTIGGVPPSVAKKF